MEPPAQGGPELKAAVGARVASTGPGFRTTPQGQPPPLPAAEGHREGLLELHTSFGELLTFFCNNATMHGTIRLVCSSPNRIKRASWALLFVGALGVLYWQLGLLLEQYWRYPVVKAVSVHSERKHFPAVTLCDMNPYRPNPVHRHLEALDAFAQENIYSIYKFNFTPSARVPSPMPHFQLDREIRLQQLRHRGGQHKVGFRLCNSTGGDCFYRAYSSGVMAAREWYQFHYVDVLALLPTAWEHGHRRPRSRFVLSCRYDREDCQARHFRMFYHPTYGSCYTFKGIWVAQRPGIAHGISLILRARPQSHLPLLSTEAGIKVTIHGHDHTPFLEHRSFEIRPGTETTIGIREDEVRRLGSPYGHCTDSTEGMGVRLLYNTSYTLQACLVSCFQQLMVDTCSCGYYLHPLPAGAQYCSHTRHPAWGHCFYRLHQELEAHRLSCASRCPRPCRETSYKLSAGTSRWPSAKSTSSVAKVNIFYQELNYQTVEEAAVYSIPELLSAMGSLWSLWFGSSVLSVLELLELLLDTVALALTLGFRRLYRVQVSQPGARTALGMSHASPEARSCGHNVPVKVHLSQMLPKAPEGVSLEELG